MVVLIIANSFRYPQVKKSNKRFYLLSLFFSAVVYASPFALVFQRSLHGIEYGFLCFNISKRSSFSFKAYHLFTFIFIFSAMILFMLPLSHQRMVYDVPTYLIAPIIVLSLFREYFHYYMDSQLFQFRDPLVRSHIYNLVLPQAEIVHNKSQINQGEAI